MHASPARYARATSRNRGSLPYVGRGAGLAPPARGVGRALAAALRATHGSGGAHLPRPALADVMNVASPPCQGPAKPAQAALPWGAHCEAVLGARVAADLARACP